MGEWRTSGERKLYLTNLPPRTTRRILAGTIKARWVCEWAHQQLKEELSLAYFEGRSLDQPAAARADDVHRVRLSAAPPPCLAPLDGAGEK